jgi:hypothetical protein
MITKLAMAGGLLASATAALANATLTAASGGQSFAMAGGQYGATTLSSSFTDGWTVSVATADVASGSPTSIDLDESSSGNTKSPLVITFTDGSFAASGAAVFSVTGSATADLSISVAITGGGSTVLVPTKSAGGVAQYATFLSALSGPSGDYTEVITITPSSKQAQQLSLDTGLTVPSVPDGSATLALLGSSFLGLAGIRREFGSKA